LDAWLSVSKDLLAGILDRMGVEAEVEGRVDEGVIRLEVKGDREEVLVGRHGRTLEALQLLLNRMVGKQVREPIRIFLNVNGYRERRTDSLNRMALRLGERVGKSGRAVTIGPFNSHDRRIIHLALKDHPAVCTESLGEEEGMKKMRILPAAPDRDLP
jgi:spoIIIJ-associated protein